MNSFRMAVRAVRLVSVGFAIVTVAIGAIGSSGRVAAHAQAPTAEEIIERVDANQHVETARSRSTMIIRTGRRELVKEMESWARGGDGLVTFLNAADRGTKYLKLGDELWMYFPDAVDLVKISGHMLRQGMMGSDFSYEDALESARLAESYEFTIVGTERCVDAACYVLDAEARPDVRVTYAKRRMWVDAELFVVRREELYAAGGRLLKVSETEEIREVAGRHFPTRTTMRDVLRKNSSTTFVIDEIELDVDIPDGTFSLRNLMM